MVSGVTRPSAPSGVVTNQASAVGFRLPLAHEVRPAPSRVAIGVAVPVAWSERQAALPGEDGIHLPSADEGVQHSTRVTQVGAAVAERQLPETTEIEDVTAVIVVRPYASSRSML